MIQYPINVFLFTIYVKKIILLLTYYILIDNMKRVIFMGFEEKIFLAIGLPFALMALFIFIVIISFFVALISLLVYFISKSIKKHKSYNKKDIDTSSIPENFKRLFENISNNSFENLEKSRTKLVFLKKATSISLVLLVIGIIVVLIGNIDSSIPMYIVIFLVLLYTILYILQNKSSLQYNRIYSEELVSNFITLLDTGLKYGENTFFQDLSSVKIYLDTVSPSLSQALYSSNENEVKKEYLSANFNRTYFNRFVSYDLMNFDFDSNNVKMRNIYLKRRIYGFHNLDILFNGIFTTVNCSFQVGTRTRVSTLNTNSNNSNDTNKFNVYNEDELNTSIFLNKEITEILSEFYNTCGINFEISLDKDKIFFKFFTGKKLEPTAFTESTNIELLYTYFCIVKFIIDLTKKIKECTP